MHIQMKLPSISEPVSQENGQRAVLYEAGCIVNDLLHEEIDKLAISKKQNTNPDTLLLSIDTYMQSVNPLLKEFINFITSTVRERQHSSVTCESDKSKQVKKVRRYFILCQLLYCTNPMQPMLINNLMSDVVEMCGGSRQLIRILNRLGCTSSVDTHDRLVTLHAETQCTCSVWDNIQNNVFTVASVDNFDMLQSYAAVYCGNQQRSYHGTTIQLVQPDTRLHIQAIGGSENNNPTCSSISDCTSFSSTLDVNPEELLQSSLLLNPIGDQSIVNVTAVPHDDSDSSSIASIQIPHNIAQLRQRQHSPDSSPHKLGKVGPKRQ